MGETSLALMYRCVLSQSFWLHEVTVSLERDVGYHQCILGFSNFLPKYILYIIWFSSFFFSVGFLLLWVFLFWSTSFSSRILRSKLNLLLITFPPFNRSMVFNRRTLLRSLEKNPCSGNCRRGKLSCMWSILMLAISFLLLTSCVGSPYGSSQLVGAKWREQTWRI